MAFSVNQKVLFRHCDPAGIVFYPRYYEMMNDCVEEFFDKTLGFPFNELHEIGGVPTAKIETKFTAPSRQGDILEIVLRCLRLGNSSLSIRITARCGKELRFQSDSTLVFIDRSGKPQSWHAKVAQLLAKCVKEDC